MSESLIKLATGIILIIATLFGGTGSSTDNYETIVYRTDKKDFTPHSAIVSEYLNGHGQGVKFAESNIQSNEFPVGPSCKFITD